MMSPNPVIELRGLSRQFPGIPPVVALQPTDLTIESGQYVSIVGPSGSGKSTLLNLLGLLDRPSSGEYFLSDKPCHEMSERERTAVRATDLGFVFQSFHLLPHRSVLENVILATIYSGMAPSVREDKARAALERVGLSHRVDFKPTLLSGGERQRVAIARAVVTAPKILLADEPTGNLDSTTTEEVLGLFSDLHQEGLTLAVITHEDEVARRAERTLRIVDGLLNEEYL